MKKLLLFPLVLVLACSTAFSQGTIKNNSYFNLIWSRPIMDNGVIYGSETPNNLREFYKAKYGDWVDKIVSWHTKSPYSHCELVFSNGEFLSSSKRDGGVSIKICTGRVLLFSTGRQITARLFLCQYLRSSITAEIHNDCTGTS